MPKPVIRKALSAVPAVPNGSPVASTRRSGWSLAPSEPLNSIRNADGFSGSTATSALPFSAGIVQSAA